MTTSSIPVISIPNRIWTLLLLVLLALVAASYLDADLPRPIILLSMVVPFALGFFSSALGVAATLAIAPLADGLVALVMYGNPSMRQQVGIFWAEPIFLGVAGGILTRLSWRGNDGRQPMLAARFYVAAVVCGLVVSLVGYIGEWHGHLASLFRIMWRSLPYMDQSQPEHVLHAALLLLAAPLWLWLVRTSVRTLGEARKAWLAWLSGAVVAALYGTSMWVRGEGQVWPRVESVLDDVNSYGSYLVLTLFVAWAMVIMDRGRKVRVFGAIVLAMMAWMLLLSGSLIALLAALAGVAALAAIGLMRKRSPLAVAAVIIAIAVLVGWRSVAVRSQPGPISRVIVQVTDPKFLLEHFRGERQAVWSATARAFLEHPIFGIGPGLLYRSLGDYYHAEDRGWRPVNENAHNYFLQLAAETGFLGVLGFLWLAWAGLRPALTGWSVETSGRTLLVIGALAYLITAVTGHPLLLSRQVILFWGFVGLISASFERSASPPEREPGRLARLSVWVIFPVFLASLLWRPASQGCPLGLGTPGPPSWDFAMGFYGTERSAIETWRWMKDAGQFKLCNRSPEPRVVDVMVATASFAEPRRLEIYSKGRRLVKTIVSPEPMRVTLPELRLMPGWTDFILVPSPSARHVDPILHNGDRRAVSLRFGDPAISIRSSR